MHRTSAEAAIAASGLKKIYIEITNRCNLACSFCAPHHRPPLTMTAADFTSVLKRIQGHTRHIALHVLGEPLLHPEFAPLLACCHAHGLQVNLATNGTLLTLHRQTLLAAPALRQISISLHSLAQLAPETGTTHLRAIIDFAKEASRLTSLYISLRLWNLGQRKQAEPNAWNGWVLAELAAAFSLPHLTPGSLEDQRGLLLAPRVFLNPESQFVWPSVKDPERGHLGTCRGLRDHLAILVDGTVVPCCLDANGQMNLGNIFQQPLAEILSSPRALRMWEGLGHQWLIEPLCRRCTYRQRFASSPSS